MGDGHWLRRKGRRGNGGQRQRTSQRGISRGLGLRRSMSLEHLEDRRMLVTYLVTSPLDIVGGATQYGSLRWAVEQANADDTLDEIVFADTVFGGAGFAATIALNGGQLDITQPLRILGPGPQKLAIQQTLANRRIFNTEIGDEDEFFTVEISGVTLSGGNLSGTGDGQRGGAIFNRERLTMVETIVSNNSASQGGGGIYVERGSLDLSRSLVQNNLSNVGGGIMVGSDDDEIFPNAVITSSTMTGNLAFGGGKDEYPVGYGGAVFNRQGRLTIVSSTIVRNSAAFGGGVAVWGAEIPETEEGQDPPPPPLATSFIYSSIVTLSGNMATDIDSVGMSDDEPPLPLLSVVESAGFNIVGVYGDMVMPHDDDLAEGTDPLFADVDLAGNYVLGDYGGTTPVFMLDAASPAIDAGGPNTVPMFPLPAFDSRVYDQRGRHFLREYDYSGAGGSNVNDIGSVERQAVAFVVDELYDEAELEGQTAGVYEIVDIDLGLINVLGYEAPGDFTLREAIAYARKNSDPSVITFSAALRTREFEDDPGAFLSPATLLLTLGQLTLQTDTTIIGPTSFILEIDASGNDLTPLVNDGKGSRVLQVSTGVNAVISNLTFMGGDINSAPGGAGILTYGNLTLIDSTVKENYAAGNGAGVAVRGGEFSVQGSTFNGNIATINGGALFADGGSTVVVSNSTFSGNTASGRGGAIANGNADLTIQSSTITLNTATTTRGSGIWTLNGAGAATRIGGSIISQNTVNDVEFAPGADTKITSTGFNLVGTGNAIGRFNEAGDLPPGMNPMLEPLMITGGQTATHRPKTGSPVLDVGDPDFDPDMFVVAYPSLPPLIFDQRGTNFVREFDVDGDGDARIDIGAYELQSSEFVVSTEVDESDGNYAFGFLSLREAIELANTNPLPDKIIFDATLVAQAPEFNLSAATLSINQSADMKIRTSMIIEGPGSALLTLNGAGLFHPLLPLLGPQRVFTIDDESTSDPIDVQIIGLSLIDATSANAPGGAIFSRENLTLDDMVLVNNHTVTYDPLLTGVVATGLHGGGIYQEGAALTVNNSTLTGNYTDAPSSDGGGVFAINSVVNFFYSTLSGNTTLQGSSRGGGMAIKNSALNASEMSIIGNATIAGLSDGGGVYMDSSSAVFEESAFGGNSTAGSNAEGGALYVTGASSQVAVEKNSTLSLNRTTGTQSSGGAAYVAGGTLSINNSTLIQNLTTGPTSPGGAAAVAVGGTLSLSGSRVKDNTTSGNNAHGGGLANLSGNLNIRDSVVSGNRAQNTSANGGGIFTDSNLAGTQATTLVNSTISGNVAASRGGGIFNADGALVIRHSTVTNNSTPFINSGNGVASFGNAATRTTVESSIIAGNVGSAAGTGSDIDAVEAQFVNSFVSAGYNVIGTGNALAKFNQPGDKIGITNPLLGPLAANGGLVDTHALMDGSPAINAGSPSFNANSFSPPLTTDQRGVGFARVLGGRIDAGAFESSFTPFSADFDLDGDVDGSDFLVWQRFNGLMAGGTKSKGDADGDGKVNATDLSIWRTQVGAGGSGSAIASSEGSVTPAAAAAVVAAPNDSASEPEAHVALPALALVDAVPPSSVRETVVIAASDASDALSSTGNVTSIASAGIPGSGVARRAAFRPAAPRGSALDAVHASLESRYARSWLSASTSSDADSPLEETAGDDDCSGNLEAEDTAFALLADGAF